MLRDPIAAMTWATSDASRSEVGRTRSRTNDPEIADVNYGAWYWLGSTHSHSLGYPTG